jgi:hypothetical protein
MRLLIKIKRKFKIFYFDYSMSQHLLGGQRKKGISDKYIYRLILKREKSKSL